MHSSRKTVEDNHFFTRIDSGIMAAIIPSLNHSNRQLRFRIHIQAQVPLCFFRNRFAEIPRPR